MLNKLKEFKFIIKLFKDIIVDFFKADYNDFMECYYLLRLTLFYKHRKIDTE